jgi:lipoate-protein ligase A
VAVPTDDPSRPIARLSPEEQIAADEKRLRAGGAGVSLALLTAPCLSLGVAQPTELPVARRARNVGLSVVRRSTGGTSVLCGEGDIAWSIILPRADPRVGRDFTHAYARFGGPITETLARTIGPTDWSPAPGLLEEVCILSSRGQVVRTPRGILGGAAQHRTGVALLHHGILHARPNRELLRELWPEVPSATFDEVAGLEDHVGFRGVEPLAHDLLRALRGSFGVQSADPVPNLAEPRP